MKEAQMKRYFIVFPVILALANVPFFPRVMNVLACGFILGVTTAMLIESYMDRKYKLTSNME
jgi:hypothetical protein